MAAVETILDEVRTRAKELAPLIRRRFRERGIIIREVFIGAPEKRLLVRILEYRQRSLRLRGDQLHELAALVKERRRRVARLYPIR